MKTPSRLIPAYVPEPISSWKQVAAYSFFALMLVALVYAVWSKPWILAACTAVAVFCAFENWMHNKKLKVLANERVDENICTFARSFDRKQVDTWVIRAIYEELQLYVEFPNGTCPLNASDKLENDLNVDPEEIEDLIPIVAQRTGRSLENTEGNSYYGKITTVGDFVQFINSQPKIVA